MNALQQPQMQSAQPQAGNMLGIGLPQIQPQQADPIQAMRQQLQSQGIDDHNAVQRLQWTIATIGSILADKNPTKSEIIDGLAEGVKDGVFTAKDAAALVPSIPDQQPALQQWLKVSFLRAKMGLQALEPHISHGQDGKYMLAMNSGARNG